MRRLAPALVFVLLFSGIALGADAQAGSPYGFLALLPALAAILLAILTRQVFVGLFVGVWIGAAILATGCLPSRCFTGFLRVLDTYFLRALADPDHAAIVLFTMGLGGMVGVIGAAGGLAALVERASRWARGPRAGQATAWIAGLVIFIDDYANTLLVGNTLRPFTDRLRISREKLAYIVDTTAAPVTSIAPISTWIGYEVGLLGDALSKAAPQVSAYDLFIDSIPYRFYAILGIALVLFIALSGRDVGAMFRAERRARTTGTVLADGAVPLADADLALPRDAAGKAWALDAIIPIAVVIGVTLAGLYASGLAVLQEAGKADGARLRDIIGKAHTFHVLMWAAFSGGVVAIVLACRRLSLRETMEAFVAGAKAMVVAMIVLVLAWSIGAISKDLRTAEYCVAAVSETVPPQLLPLIIFAIAAAVSFATGTSWGTMAILIPIAIPLGVRLVPGGDPGESPFLFASAGAILSGAIFG
ncbi:MAG: Na+/H+ antiporter NhaC family protein, partial [Planctomycetes bacterium]|nr:Na+/H+ antiporter NhaC family protein [Planctomycetota bacterium]